MLYHSWKHNLQLDFEWQSKYGEVKIRNILYITPLPLFKQYHLRLVNTMTFGTCLLGRKQKNQL